MTDTAVTVEQGPLTCHAPRVNESEAVGPVIQAHQVVPLVERQHALIENLRVRDPQVTTARQLAERLGVSTRTVERDLARLREAGIPLTVASGPGGGYRLAARTAVPAQTFTPGEVSALLSALVAVGPFTSATAQSAFAKLVDLLAGDIDTRE